jgi:hypothetical protein
LINRTIDRIDQQKYDYEPEELNSIGLEVKVAIKGTIDGNQIGGELVLVSEDNKGELKFFDYKNPSGYKIEGGTARYQTSVYDKGQSSSKVNATNADAAISESKDKYDLSMSGHKFSFDKNGVAQGVEIDLSKFANKLPVKLGIDKGLLKLEAGVKRSFQIGKNSENVLEFEAVVGGSFDVFKEIYESRPVRNAFAQAEITALSTYASNPISIWSPCGRNYQKI